MNYADLVRIERATHVVVLRAYRDGRVDEALDLVTRTTRPVVMTGVGKSGLVAARAAATWTSLGLRATFVHAHDALHGGLGTITPDQLVIALTQSCRTPEVLDVVNHANVTGAEVIVVSGERPPAFALWLDSSCAEVESAHGAPIAACHAQATWLDAVVLAWCQKYPLGTQAAFKTNHPGGAIGERLA